MRKNEIVGSRILLRDIEEYITPLDGGRCRDIAERIIYMLQIERAKNKLLRRKANGNVGN